MKTKTIPLTAFNEQSFYSKFSGLRKRWSNKTNPWLVTSCWLIDVGVLWVELTCMPESIALSTIRKESFLLWDNEHWEWTGDDRCDPTYTRIGLRSIRQEKPSLGKLQVCESSALQKLDRKKPEALRLEVSVPELDRKALRGKTYS